MSTNDYAKGYSQAIEDVAKGGHTSALYRDYGIRLISNEPKDGGPAFPRTGGEVPGPNSSEWVQPQSGMTMRDWFAGNADVSGVEFPDTDTAAKALGIDPPFDESPAELIRFGARVAAACRYMFADAMLDARSLSA